MHEINIFHETMRGDGISLHVARAGEGTPIVLLHGFPENWRSWRHQMAALAEAGYSVFAPDLRGYNQSERPRDRSDYHLRHLVEDVAALVRTTGRAHVAGHDWGGIIAWTFAGAHPELLDKLVILNAPHLQLYLKKILRPPQMFRSWYVLLFQIPGLAERVLAAGKFAAIRHMFRRGPARKGAFSEAEIAMAVEALAQPGALTAGLNYYRALRLPGAEQMAVRARTDAETLVLWGDRDPALGTNLLEGIERLAPRAHVVRFPDVSHWIQNEAPAEVNRVLLEFLRS